MRFLLTFGPAISATSRISSSTGDGTGRNSLRTVAKAFTEFR